MTNNIDKIRAALEQEPGASRGQALAALAALEQSAAEPVATVCLITDRFAHNHCIEAQLQVDPRTQLPIGTKLYLQPPAPVAEMREVVVTDEMAMRACERIFGSNVGDGYAKPAREWLKAWRAELGPALGMVEIREPTPEECRRICTEYERLLMRVETCGGRDAFDAVRAVMWPKEGL